MTTVVLFGGIVSLLGVTVWLGLLIWAAKGDGRVQREHDQAARIAQSDPELPADREGGQVCANCARVPRPGESHDNDWRTESDGTGDLLVFCPECWQREFGGSG